MEVNHDEFSILNQFGGSSVHDSDIKEVSEKLLLEPKRQAALGAASIFVWVNCRRVMNTLGPVRVMQWNYMPKFFVSRSSFQMLRNGSLSRMPIVHVVI